MSDVLQPRPPATIEEFFAWEVLQELTHEWDGVQPVAMTGGTLAHNLIANRVANALENGLRGKPCTVFRSDARVLTERGMRARYPDIVVTCSPIRGRDRDVPNPVVIVEVLSETTAPVDRGIKRAEYGALPSLERYVILASDMAIAAIHERQHGFAERYERDALTFGELGVSVTLDDIYRGLL